MATQAERRQSTIRRLLDAAVLTVAERGYGRASTAAICKRAGVSQGALFRHFDTRMAVIAATTELIGRSNVEAIDAMRATLPSDVDPIGAIVRFARLACRSPSHAAWHEVMVAARTDPALRSSVAPILADYEGALRQLARSLVDDSHPDPLRAEAVVLSVLHMFDSEAVTRRIHDDSDLEAVRLVWATEIMTAELKRPRPSSR